MTATHLDTITSSINERRFFEHLKAFFSTSTVVLSECMQNARRAGADRVWFEFDEGTATLTITDNGCGIEDFRALLTVAESGWNEQTMEDERPFGIGFFSACFAADRVRVQSRRHQVTFTSEELAAKCPVAIESSEYFIGTRVILEGCKLEMQNIESSIQAYAKGFAIPVFWQGKEQPRPHARATLRGIDTPVGFVHAPGIHTLTIPKDYPRYVLYYQGLPVRGFAKHYRYYYDNEIVIHVDQKRYLPRMPDRDALIDESNAWDGFHAQVESLWRETLLRKKESLSALEFANTYWHVANQKGCLDIMCDVPVIPVLQLSLVEYTPIRRSFENGFLRFADEPVTLEKVQSGETVLYKGPISDFKEEGAYFARLAWAKEKKALFVCGLPPGHWAEPYIRDLFERPIEIGGRRLATETLDGEWVEADVSLMDGLSVTMEGMTVPLSEALAIWSAGCCGRGAILVPNGENARSGDVLRQASSFLDKRDVFRSDALERDQARLEDLIAIMSGELPEETLKKCLGFARANGKSNLCSCEFHISFDVIGQFNIARCAPA